MNGGEPAIEPVPAEELARARLAVYGLVGAGLAAPTPAQHAWMGGADFAASLAALCELFGLTSPPTPLVPGEFADHQARYLASFEVGLPAAPVVLLASHYQRREPAPRIIYEHILFYRRFGVRVPARSLEPANHLGHQLAFLMHLDGRLLEGHLDPESLRWARRDFLARHLAWVDRAAFQAMELGLAPVYQALLAVLAAALRQDRELTAEVAG
jgi:TorA maturation chaperone TorD